MKYAAFAVLPFLSLPAAGQLGSLVSRSSTGIAGNSGGFLPAITGDGWTVAFVSPSTNLVPGDTNGKLDVFVRIHRSTTERVSVSSSGIEGNGRSFECQVSGDGRFVVFASEATNLVPGDTNGQPDVFVRDLVLGTTTRVNVGAGGAQSASGFYTGSARISRSGRYVAFHNEADDLVPGDTNGGPDVFLRDRLTNTITRVSTRPDGSQIAGGSSSEDLSPDGRFLVFNSDAGDILPGDSNNAGDVFVRDLQAGTIERASVTWEDGDSDGLSFEARITPDGRYVAFTSLATDLVPDDTNGFRDVFVRDRWLGTTERVSVTSEGAQGFHDSFTPAISADGRFVLFGSLAHLAPGASSMTNYVRDRVLGLTTAVTGFPGSDVGSNGGAVMTPDASSIAIRSLADGQIYLRCEQRRVLRR